MPVWTTAVSVAAVLVAAPLSGPTASPSPSLACGDTVATYARLTRDLRCTDVGLVVLPGATLDLGGHRLVGPGSGSGSALVSDGSDSDAAITVRNGTIEGFRDGLSGEPPFTVVVERVTFSHLGIALGADQSTLRVSDSRFEGNGQAVSLFESSADITRTAFVGNGGGIEIGSGGFSELTVADSTFSGNGTAVSCDEAGVVVTGSRFVRNTTGVSTSYCVATLERSAFVENGTAVEGDPGESLGNGGVVRALRSTFNRNTVGIELRVGAVVEGSTFTGNGTALRSAPPNDFEDPLVRLVASRFTRNGDAVVLESSSAIGTTTATRNTGYGIYAPLATDLGGNVAWGNGTEPQCTGVVCAGRRAS